MSQLKLSRINAKQKYKQKPKVGKKKSEKQQNFNRQLSASKVADEQEILTPQLDDDTIEQQDELSLEQSQEVIIESPIVPDDNNDDDDDDLQELEQQLMQFQRQHGLKPDGIAGNQTLIQLNLYLSQQGPRLSASEERR